VGEVVTLAIYKTDGEICRVHALEDGKDYSVALADFQKTYEGTNNSVLIETFEDGSLISYLFKTREANLRDLRESLSDISCAIYRLDSNLEWVRDKIDELEKKEAPP
jgi:hypothetical protein